MDRVEVVLDTTKLDAAARALLTDLIPRLVEWGGKKVEEQAKDIVPVRIGHLKNSIQSTLHLIDGGAEAHIGPGAEYGIHVEFGVRPYQHPGVSPVTKKALFWPGAEHPVRRVKPYWHPGMQPRPFMRPALAKVGPIFEEALRSKIAELAK